MAFPLAKIFNLESSKTSASHRFGQSKCFHPAFEVPIPETDRATNHFRQRWRVSSPKATSCQRIFSSEKVNLASKVSPLRAFGSQ